MNHLKRHQLILTQPFEISIFKTSEKKLKSKAFETSAEYSFLFEFKKGEDFNRRNTLSISRIKLWAWHRNRVKRDVMQRSRFYWLPRPLCTPQSGHCHVIPLQDIPQKFSSRHSWQMLNPHLHGQLNVLFILQQWQLSSFALSLFSLYDNLPE